MNATGIYHHVSGLLNDYLHLFGMNAPAGPLRAVAELTCGIVWTGSVQLSNAARLFCQTPEQLEHAVKRISEHLSDPHWDHRPWTRAILADQVRHIGTQSLIPIDATELAKPYAQHMEHQCIVRDASRPGDPLVNGYWCWGAYHWQESRQSLVPLMLQPYSQQQPRFRSENEEWCRCFWALRTATQGRGIWVHDRGADRPEILSAWLRVQPRWIIRLRRDRALIGPAGSKQSAGAWADWALDHRPERGRAVTLPVRLPPEDVPQFGAVPPLWLLVPTYRLADGDRWLLLTCGLIDQHTGPRQIRRMYGLRWRGEDAKRFLGQIWHVERFLTRSFLALERMLWCVVLAGGFLARLQCQERSLSRQLESEVLYWDKPYKIRACRMARGLQAVAGQAGRLALSNNA